MRELVARGWWLVEASAKALSTGRVFSTRHTLQATSLLLLLATDAHAMPKFRLQAIQQLHYDVGNPLWEYDRRVMACTYCHVNDSGGAPWNSFGQALQAQFQVGSAAKNKFPQVLYDLLKKMQDSDGDGYPDALEVFAHTLPGDPTSKPAQSLQALQAAFDKAGGVSQYAPVSAAKPSGK